MEGRVQEAGICLIGSLMLSLASADRNPVEESGLDNCRIQLARFN